MKVGACLFVFSHFLFTYYTYITLLSIFTPYNENFRLFTGASASFTGDQIVGATVYFDNMSPEETAELLKTLNRHKVGLKLQNKGDKSPGYSPLSTPCRSPMGTLTWEGRTRFGSSSPDILLVGSTE